MILVDGERIKGSIYFDRTVKKVTADGRKLLQNGYRANVFYDGQRYEKRSKNEDVLRRWLTQLSMKHRNKSKKKNDRN